MSENYYEKSRETPQVEMNKIDVLCCQALQITDQDIKDMRDIIEDQRDFMIPLMPATTEWQHQLADYNERVLEKVLELKALIVSGESIVQPKETIKLFEDEEEIGELTTEEVVEEEHSK